MGVAQERRGSTGPEPLGASRDSLPIDRVSPSGRTPVLNVSMIP